MAWLAQVAGDVLKQAGVFGDGSSDSLVNVVHPEALPAGWEVLRRVSPTDAGAEDTAPLSSLRATGEATRDNADGRSLLFLWGAGGG